MTSCRRSPRSVPAMATAYRNASCPQPCRISASTAAHPVPETIPASRAHHWDDRLLHWPNSGALATNSPMISPSLSTAMDDYPRETA
jgi:hypothetical protein